MDRPYQSSIEGRRVGFPAQACPRRLLRNEALATALAGLKSVDTAATSEIERYVVWPAQALGYQLGQLKILALRESAQEAFGDAFDIRDFNQQVLDVASTPLPFIEATVISWILSTPE